MIIKNPFHFYTDHALGGDKNALYRAFSALESGNDDLKPKSGGGHVEMPHDTRFKGQAIIIAGPTASGKSSLALDLARHIGPDKVVIINADSMQIYKFAPILTACPNEGDQTVCPHFLYEYFDFTKDICSVQRWVDLVHNACKNLWREGKLPIIVGGTGLYIESLLRPLHAMPDISKDLLGRVDAMFDMMGRDAFYQKLLELDPGLPEHIMASDTQRMKRAMAVMMASGKGFSVWHQAGPMTNNVKDSAPTSASAAAAPASVLNEAIIWMLEPERQWLYKRCNTRFDQMLGSGGLEESFALYQHMIAWKKEVGGIDGNAVVVGGRSIDDHPLLRAVGIRELLAYHGGECSLEEACDHAKMMTRRLAKRQMTWLRGMERRVCR